MPSPEATAYAAQFREAIAPTTPSPEGAAAVLSAIAAGELAAEAADLLYDLRSGLPLRDDLRQAVKDSAGGGDAAGALVRCGEIAEARSIARQAWALAVDVARAADRAARGGHAEARGAALLESAEDQHDAA